MNNTYLLYFFFGGLTLFMLLAVSLAFMLIKYHRRLTIHKNELLKSQVQAQEEAMKLISEELHDNIGQLLTLSRIHAQSIMDKADNSALHPLAHSLHSLLTKAVNEVRFISHGLNSAPMEQIGLHSSIEREAENVGQSVNIRCRVIYPKEEHLLNTEQKLLIFRIVQEVIQNVVKHSQATIFIILIRYTSQGMYMGFRDNGRGFDVEKAVMEGGLGMRNINSRVDLLKGTLKWKSQDNYGTKVIMNIPYHYGI